MKKVAIVIGATGAIGQCLLTELVACDFYQVIHTIGRNLPTEKYNHVIHHIADFDDLDRTLSLGPFTNGEVVDVFCSLGSTIKQSGSKSAFKKIDHDYVINFANYVRNVLCKSSSNFLHPIPSVIHNFTVISAINANVDSSLFYNQVKGAVEDDLISLNFNRLTIMRPSLLYGSRKKIRMKESISYGFLWLLTPMLIGKYKKFRAIHIKQVANAMISVSQYDDYGVRIIENDELLSIK